ncbi:MAG TPA: hypothetical protein VMH82_05405 [Myxococcota bacterium]|nr:hypothetical protein [Myxococcota bacterium]
MQVLGLVGILAFAAASFAVGLRLSWTGLRRGGIPESTIGLSFLLAGGIGTLLLIASNGAGAAQALLRAASLGFINLGIAVLGVFNWRVFRPDRTGALLFATFASLLALSFSADLARRAFLDQDPRPPLWIATDAAGRIGMYGWGCCETLWQCALARRRVRLGLGDPLVADRFLLWGIGTLSVIGIWVHAYTRELLGATSADGEYLVVALLGGLCAAAIWLAFFPPKAYVRRAGAGRAAARDARLSAP